MKTIKLIVEVKCSNSMTTSELRKRVRESLPDGMQSVSFKKETLPDPDRIIFADIFWQTKQVKQITMRMTRLGRNTA